MKLKRGFCFNIIVSKIGQTVQTVPIFSEKLFLEKLYLEIWVIQIF